MKGFTRSVSDSSNSFTGSSSTAVTPSCFRYGIFSISPAKVPGCATPEDGCAGEAAHVHFVNDAVDQRDIQRLIVFPVEMVFHDQAVAVRARSRLYAFPTHAPFESSARVGIEQHVLADRSDRLCGSGLGCMSKR